MESPCTPLKRGYLFSKNDRLVTKRAPARRQSTAQTEASCDPRALLESKGIPRASVCPSEEGCGSSPKNSKPWGLWETVNPLAAWSDPRPLLCSSSPLFPACFSHSVSLSLTHSPQRADMLENSHHAKNLSRPNTSAFSGYLPISLMLIPSAHPRSQS